MSKKWITLPPPPSEFCNEHPELPRIITGLLWNRGLKTQEQIDEFLNPDYSKNIHDPFLFNDMEKAVDIIFDCIKKDEKIVVHGDYDADGVDAAAIIISTLKILGAKNVDVFIPHREIDGYGLNKKTVAYLKDQGAKLIITCDCGISNTEEVTLAKELGIKVIITDHHSMPLVFPPADAIIHPLVPGENYPDKTLSGGGVAFKLAQGLLRDYKQRVLPSVPSVATEGKSRTHSTAVRRPSEEGEGAGGGLSVLPNGQTAEAFEKWLLDLVAISTVADMVPLLGESRTLVRYGLTVLNKTKNIGLKKLLIRSGLFDENGKPKRAFSTHTISFQLAPRINAAGRMDHANVAFKLLVAQTEAEAEALAEQLNQNNLDRQKLTEKLVIQARYQIVEGKQENNPILFIVGDGWGTGLLGLIAGKIKDEFNRPALVMGINKGIITGSGRSVAGFNLIETLKSIPEFFDKYGGHPMACGFSLKGEFSGVETHNYASLQQFKTAMLEKASVALKDADLTPQLKIDAEVDLDEVNWKLYDILQKLEPFGVANEEPVYAATKLTVISVDPVGQDGKHLRLIVKHNSHVTKKTIAFGFGDCEKHPANWKDLKSGEKIDLAFTVGVNEWNGNRELQLQVEDIRRTK